MFYTGWTLANEHFQGTLDLLVTARTPVALIMLGKSLAVLVWQLPASVVSFLIVLAFSRELTPVAEPGLLLVSAVLATASVVAFSFIFAPIGLLTGARNGWFSALMPLGSVISGFLYPIGLLPAGLEAIARCLPSAWAMEAVVRSVNGTSSTERIVVDWAVAVLLSGVFLVATVVLFDKAENRVRKTGSLSRV